MWDEIQDMPGEIFDMDQFNEMKEELMEVINACVELEEAN
jgi:septum formation topological specificity factor MinE